ncbi:MAG: cupin domain-containing protein [Parafannyhessea sp.]|uniref:cupin domain-containing protein n=1 Tax=Parafannyhessea sp. TaxID=2847324 RepID=UPI003F0370F6
MDVAHNSGMKLALMSFDAGTGLDEHSAPGEALVFALDGEGVIGYEGEEHVIHTGENFKFDKNGRHFVRADKRFKMALLLTLEQGEKSAPPGSADRASTAIAYHGSLEICSRPRLARSGAGGLTKMEERTTWRPLTSSTTPTPMRASSTRTSRRARPRTTALRSSSTAPRSIPPAAASPATAAR